VNPRNIYLILSIVTLGCNNLQREEDLSGKPLQTPVQIIVNPAPENSALPRLYSNDSGLYLSWVTQQDSVSHLQYAVYKNSEWTDSHEVSSGTDWFVNWADFPQISENKGKVLTSFLQKSAGGTYTYDIKLNLTQATQEAIRKNFILHNDSTLSEHGFVSMHPWNDQFFVSWLDGRNTTGGHEDHSMHGGGAMTLRGAFIDTSGTITHSVALDTRVCDCCNTATTTTPHGILVAYRDRSEEEVRDIAVVRYEDGKWGAPQRIGNDLWKIPGCPVNGPALDAWKENVAIAWFTGVNDEGKVQIAFSKDEGSSFGPAIRVDSGNATGRVDVVLLNEKEAGILWMEPMGDDEVIQFMRVSMEGQTSEKVTIAKTIAERASGFPQMETYGDSLYVAWTLHGDQGNSIQMARISLNDL
jgi:hypothetical protein